MRSRRRLNRNALGPLWLVLIALQPASTLHASEAPPVLVPAGIDHAPFTALLQRYVDRRGLVAYDRWRAAHDDRAALETYLEVFAPAPATASTGPERHAALINLYNALAIAEVLRRKPQHSLWDFDPFTKRIHPLGGHRVSLDDIEHRALRPETDYRVHAVLVCAALSCPPLAREAFRAEDLDQRLTARFDRWLATERLNRFDLQAETARISKLFDWYAADFEPAGGIYTVLARHAPERYREALRAEELEISFLPYDTSLNRQPAAP